MSKSNHKKSAGYGPNGDDRKKANKTDRRKVKDFLTEGQYDGLPKRQKLNKYGVDESKE